MASYLPLNPVAFKIGGLTIYWYGLMYLLGFVAAYYHCLKRGLKSIPPWDSNSITDLISYVAVGVILGGRLGYLLFYEPELLIEDPLSLFYFWEPGRSFHGGLLGVLVAILLFCYVHKRAFLVVTDFVAPAVPLGLSFGRIGNFINGELWGRVTDLPWGMVFPNAGNLPRHPSQLYEAFLEGILLYIILNLYSAKPRPVGRVSALFLICYGIFRILIEFFREPDAQLGFLALNWITMGQLLSLPMVLVGIFLMRRGNASIS